MQKPLTLGIAGLGNVGGSLLDLLHTHKVRIAERAGRPVEIVGISARSKGKDRGVDTAGIKWFDDPVALAKDPSIEAFVELIGGSDGIAKEAVEAALRAGKHVVTANKALLAKHGVKLAKLLVEKASVAVSPGLGFGEYGEGFIRIALVENEHRIRQAARNLKKFLAQAPETMHNVIPIQQKATR